MAGNDKPKLTAMYCLRSQRRYARADFGLGFASALKRG